MFETEIHADNKRELIAAIHAAAQPTYEMSKANPTRIVFGTCTYMFKEGLHESRVRSIVRNIRAMRIA